MVDAFMAAIGGERETQLPSGWRRLLLALTASVVLHGVAGLILDYYWTPVTLAPRPPPPPLALRLLRAAPPQREVTHVNTPLAPARPLAPPPAVEHRAPRATAPRTPSKPALNLELPPELRIGGHRQSAAPVFSAALRATLATERRQRERSASLARLVAEREGLTNEQYMAVTPSGRTQYKRGDGCFELEPSVSAAQRGATYWVVRCHDQAARVPWWKRSVPEIAPALASDISVDVVAGLPAQ